MKLAIVTGSILFVCSALAYAQEALVGKYTGSMAATAAHGGNVVQVGIVIDITSAENGRLKGTITNTGQTCGGTFPMEGGYRDNSLKFAMLEGGGVQGCRPLRFVGAAEGNKLVGKFSWAGGMQDAVFSK